MAEGFIRSTMSAALRFPVLIEFRLRTGFSVLPMQELGSDMSHEVEFLLPPGGVFEIKKSHYVSVAGVEKSVLHVILEEGVATSR